MPPVGTPDSGTSVRPIPDGRSSTNMYFPSPRRQQILLQTDYPSKPDSISTWYIWFFIDTLIQLSNSGLCRPPHALHFPPLMNSGRRHLIQLPSARLPFRDKGSIYRLTMHQRSSRILMASWPLDSVGMWHTHRTVTPSTFVPPIEHLLSISYTWPSS